MMLWSVPMPVTAGSRAPHKTGRGSEFPRVTMWTEKENKKQTEPSHVHYCPLEGDCHETNSSGKGRAPGAFQKRATNGVTFRNTTTRTA